MIASTWIAERPTIATLRPFVYAVIVVGVIGAFFAAELFAGFALMMLSVLLLGYLAFEVRALPRVGVARLLLVAPVAASLFTFAIPFGVTNALYLIPLESRPDALDIFESISPAMVKVAVLAIIGAVGMWFGFRLGIGHRLADVLLTHLRLQRTLARDHVLNPVVVVALVLASIAARIIAIRLGVYGYSAEIESAAQWADVRQFLSIADASGKLALIIVSLVCFAPNRKSAPWGALALITALEIAFGVLSGFKSQIVMPVIIIVLAHVAQRGSIPKLAVPGIAIAILASYQLVEPFRILRYQDAAFRGTSIVDIAEGVVRAQEYADEVTIHSADLFFVFASRHHSTYIASLGVDYADTETQLPDGAPNFLGNIFLAPLHAVVPRALWPEKPEGTLGSWYRTEVLGVSDQTSVGMTPVTYLYFAGGYLAVFLGFAAIGVVQRASMVALLGRGPGGMVIYLGLFRLLVDIDSSFNSILIAFIRESLALWLVQLVAFRSQRSP